MQNLKLLALSSVEKSVTVQTHTHTKLQKNEQTVNDISTPCLWACVDNNIDNDDNNIYVALWDSDMQMHWW